jgi:hypothetical protein
MPKGFAYLTEEVDSFLDLLEDYLPISSTAWERVAEVHLTRYPDLKRSVDSLKRKFKELHNNKNLTGDPLCPPAVRRAKRLRVEIICRLDASDLNSEEGEDSLEGGDTAPANLGGDCKDDEVGLGWRRMRTISVPQGWVKIPAQLWVWVKREMMHLMPGHPRGHLYHLV